jgi:hypothetical protein
VLLLAALAVHVGLGRPAWREEAALAERASSLGAERQALLDRVAALERADVLAARSTRMELPPGANDDGVARLRRSLLESLQGQAVSGVRLAVAPAPPPLAAEGHLQAEGTFAEVVQLSGQLVRPGAGFVLKRVRLAPTPHGSLALEVEGVSVLEEAP